MRESNGWKSILLGNNIIHYYNLVGINNSSYIMYCWNYYNGFEGINLVFKQASHE